MNLVVSAAYKLTKELPVTERCELSSQIGRAVSVLDALPNAEWINSLTGAIMMQAAQLTDDCRLPIAVCRLPFSA
jgi:hypothetical protein